jgi:hypothetical protein
MGKGVYDVLRVNVTDVLSEVRRQFGQDAWNKHGKLFEITLAKIEADTQANQALKILIRKGCNPAVVLREIGLFCRMDGSGLEKRAKHARGVLERISARLKDDASNLADTVNEFAFDSYGHYNELPVFPPSLGDVAKSLALTSVAFKKHTHLKIIRNKHLVYLYYHIKAATSAPHYKEIAQLVACMPGQAESNVVLLADGLRNRIQRHIEHDPEFFRTAKIAIERDLSSWQYFFC